MKPDMPKPDMPKPDMVNPDLELETWREQWQAHTEVPADLRGKVERGSRNMRLLLALEVLITVVLGGGSTLLAIVDQRTGMVVLSVAVWVFLGAAWTFAIMNRRGTWSPSAVSTEEFLDLSIRRCKRRLASTAFGAGLYVAEMAFCLTWLYWDPARREPLPAIIFGVMTPLFALGLLWYRRKTTAELKRLLEVQGIPSSDR